ncbi:protein kinase domain-containing protein [Dictyobacter kobayashii]|uniref:non-specific serine/threonine protein kinase n=1 Tax=Dictyobacter kobayashii TaxID=2014872 RepID=A0A402ANN5_9CHLR|nr:protein kinase [Dictyobacter kobayashii]GCE20726.1 hypothetical protein KDK_45260 [Dictyobacter kobayashii]
MADALQYAHDEHIIHRDIKPENMLVGRRGEILLSDFGIALVAQSSRYQGTQDVIGTVAYMSPEQIQGKPRPASDQYSLAIVVYEWLTGDRPFHGSFTEMCTQHMFAAPPPIREKLAQVSPEVERVVMQALDKDPKKRFENVKSFAGALAQAGQSNQTELMANTGTSNTYSTVAMPTGSNIPPQTPNNTAFPPAPHTVQQSQPFNPLTSSPSNNTYGTRQMGTQQNSQPAPTGRENTTGQAANQGQAPTMHSSTTMAQTNNMQRGNNPNSAYPQQQQQGPGAGGGQSGPAKMILPGQAPQSGPNNGPRPPFPANPQQYAQQQQQQQYPRPPQQQYPNMQRPPQSYPGYNNGRPEAPYQGQQGYPQPQNRQNQFEQQQSMSRQPSYNNRTDRDYDEPAARSTPRTHQEMPRESMEDWLGPLNAWKWPILATIVGIILFCVLHSFMPEIYNRNIPVLLVLPLFFGAAFGPIVGILVGAGGAMVADFMYRGNDSLTTTLFHNANFGPQYHAWWFPLAFYGVAGLITGLTMLRRRKFPSIGSSIRASLLAVIALAAIVGFILYNAKELRLFPELGLIVLINIAISLIILVVYSIMGRLIDPA